MKKPIQAGQSMTNREKKKYLRDREVNFQQRQQSYVQATYFVDQMQASTPDMTFVREHASKVDFPYFLQALSCSRKKIAQFELLLSLRPDAFSVSHTEKIADLALSLLKDGHSACLTLLIQRSDLSHPAWQCTFNETVIHYHRYEEEFNMLHPHMPRQALHLSLSAVCRSSNCKDPFMMVKQLVQLGADPAALGSSAFEYACKPNQWEIADYLSTKVRLKVIQHAILMHGAEKFPHFLAQQESHALNTVIDDTTPALLEPKDALLPQNTRPRI